MALRSASLIFEMHSSVGLKSGEYLGMCLTPAPAASIKLIERPE
jgi:hypothetical protein